MDPFILTLSIRGTIAICLAAGGLYALNRGYSLFKNRIGLQPDESVFDFGKVKINAKSVGTVVMVTASFWGYLSVRCLPQIEGHGMRVADLSANTNELIKLSDAVTQAIVTSQDFTNPQTVLQATLKTSLSSAMSVPSTNVNVTTYEYDSTGRLTNVNINNTFSFFTYDSLGRIKSIGDQTNINATVYDYDNTSSRLSSVNGIEGITKYEYDERGRVKSVISRALGRMP